MKAPLFAIFAATAAAYSKTCDQLNSLHHAKSWCMRRETDDCKWVTIEGLPYTCIASTTYQLPQNSLSECFSIEYKTECTSQAGQRCHWDRIGGKLKCVNNKRYTGPVISNAAGAETKPPRKACSEFYGASCNNRRDCFWEKVSKTCCERGDSICTVLAPVSDQTCSQIDMKPGSNAGRRKWCLGNPECTYSEKRCFNAGSTPPGPKTASPTPKPTCSDINLYYSKNKKGACQADADCTYYSEYKQCLDKSAEPPTWCTTISTYWWNRKKSCQARKECLWHVVSRQCLDKGGTAQPTTPSPPKTNSPTTFVPPTLPPSTPSTTLTPGPTGDRVYKLISTGPSCESAAGCQRIQTQSECDAAMRQKTVSTTLQTQSKSTTPRGCFLYADRNVWWNTDFASVGVGRDCTSLRQCLCSCEKTPTSAPTAAPTTAPPTAAPTTAPPTDSFPQRPNDADCSVFNFKENQAACNAKNGCVFNPTKNTDPTKKLCVSDTTVKEWCNAMHGQEAACQASIPSGCKWNSDVNKCQVL